MTRNKWIEQAEKRLLQRTGELLGLVRCELNELRNLHDQSVGDLADRGVEAQAGDVTSGLATSESRELALIEDALWRLENGTYGTCEDCDKPIPVRRLQVIPYAECCLMCEQKRERSKLMVA